MGEGCQDLAARPPSRGWMGVTGAPAPHPQPNLRQVLAHQAALSLSHQGGGWALSFPIDGGRIRRLGALRLVAGGWGWRCCAGPWRHPLPSCASEPRFASCAIPPSSRGRVGAVLPPRWGKDPETWRFAPSRRWMGVELLHRTGATPPLKLRYPSPIEGEGNWPLRPWPAVRRRIRFPPCRSVRGRRGSTGGSRA